MILNYIVSGDVAKYLSIWDLSPVGGQIPIIIYK